MESLPVGNRCRPLQFRSRLGRLGVVLTALVMQSTSESAGAARSVEAIRGEIFATAERFRGLGDERYERQKTIGRLVDELLAVAPQPPVEDRLSLILGAWQQVWGPYDYRGGRGVDPSVDPDHIYQVVFPGGYYYNVTPSDVRETTTPRKVTLLRGEYTLDARHPGFLRVRFTRFDSTRFAGPLDSIWQLATLAERDTLKNRSWILPRFLVRWLFGGGALREVYTDETLRLTYGGDSLTDRSKEFLYVLRRMPPTNALPQERMQ